MDLGILFGSAVIVLALLGAWQENADEARKQRKVQERKDAQARRDEERDIAGWMKWCDEHLKG